MKLKENYLIKLIIFVLCIYPISVKAKENEIGKSWEDRIGASGS